MSQSTAPSAKYLGPAASDRQPSPGTGPLSAVDAGTIEVAALPGGLDLQATLESGQSYVWGRDDGALYADDDLAGGEAWYHAVLDGEAVRVRQRDGRLEWESTTDAGPLLADRLRLGDDLEAIAAGAPDDLVAAAWDAFGGMRLIRDPFFPTLVAFICSAQMQVARIADTQAELRRRYGETVALGDRTYHASPTPEALATATEAELRDVGLGYRAPYVRETAAMVADGELTRADVVGLPYEDAREALTGFVGVGDKVADCVLLFSLGYLEAVPLDTWIRGAVAEHYPACDRANYAETSRAIRKRLGGDLAGYHQTYLFHSLRTG